jgi:hypothetical protein
LASNSIVVSAISARGDSFGGTVSKPIPPGASGRYQVAFLWRKGHGHRLIPELSSVEGISADGARAVPALTAGPEKRHEAGGDPSTRLAAFGRLARSSAGFLRRPRPRRKSAA